MASTSLALQKAILDAIAGIEAPNTTGAAGALVPVYDYEPQNAALPAIVLTRHQVDSLGDTLDGNVDSHDITLEIWTDYHGQRQTVEIVEAIYSRLHNADLRLVQGICVACRVQSRTAERLADDASYRGQVVVIATTQNGD